MVQISLIVLSITGIIIVNLLNKDKPLFKIGGTAVIILSCVLAMLYYYNIRMFADTATIVLTITLTVSLLLLAYIILMLAVNYKKGKMDVRKKDISKRSTFKKSEKKNKRRELSQNFDGDMPQDSKLSKDKRDKRKGARQIPQDGDEIKTVSDYLNQIEDDKNEEHQEADKAQTVKKSLSNTHMDKRFEDEINIEETESAEEWTPSMVSDDEIEAYMKEQYAWMEANKPENELSMSLVFGGSEEAAEPEDGAYHPEVISKTANIKDIKVRDKSARLFKTDEEIQEIDIELEEQIEYSQFDDNSITYEAESAAEVNKNKRGRRDEAAALKDWVNAQSLRDRQSDTFTGNYETQELSEQNFAAAERAEETLDKKDFEELSSAGYNDKDETDVSVIEVIDQSGAEFDYTQTVDQAVEAGEKQSSAYEEINEISVTEIHDDDINEFKMDEQSIFTDMLSDNDEDLLSDEEAEQYAQNFFVNDIAGNTPEPVFIDILSQQEEPEPVENKEDENIKELSMPEKKAAEFAELTQLVKDKNYTDAMKKVFSILNAGYVMTPDEKQQMRIIMLTLKAKT